MAKLIIFDIDGTLTRHMSSWQYLHEHLEVWDGKADRYQKQFWAGKISYREFCRLDAAHWKGLSARRVHRIFGDIPYARNAHRYIHLLRKRGFKLAALSTGLQFMAERVKRELGLHYVIANRLFERGGKLTGAVRINVGYGGKGRLVGKIMRKFRASRHETICVGDGAGDIPMVRRAGYSIAFNSSSSELSKAVDYDCHTKDFKEVYEAIMKYAEKPRRMK